MTARPFPDPDRGFWECQNRAGEWIYFGGDRARAERCQAMTGCLMRYVEIFEVCETCRSADLKALATAGGAAVMRCIKCGGYQ